ncbi:radical SAM protein, partial [Desulfurivibrio sp. C05AmB]|uniref:radical SAM protein n=1 Tax=Desulfurivibrio sp. C05AmB TaxID=3374371 RepID=UPI00376F3053
ACDMCPRRCGVNRLAGELGVCRTGAQAVVASYGPHFGEEEPLVGRMGSGTIFFSNCNLGCVFCQNYEISHLGAGEAVTAAELAAMMLALQDQGCANINLVTPSHVVAQILAALEIAAEGGLKLPLVYNSSGYDAVETLALLDGVVDIYMPDFKFWDSASARRLAKAPDYPQQARAALLEMHRQVGDLQLDRRGLARRGLLVRHLVMPGGTAESEAILQFIADELSPATYVNIMEQYHPCGQAGKYPPLDRPLAPGEYERVLDAARRAGLRRLDERIGARLLRRLP